MFENVRLFGTELSLNKAKEIADVVLNDPQWREFSPEGTNFRDSMETLKNYVADDPELHGLLNTMRVTVEELSYASNMQVNELMSLNGHRAISGLNKLNGYQLSNDVGSDYPERYMNAQEITEKTPGTSLTERVYAYMERKNYEGIQTDPKAKMLIHLAHLSEKMMGKLPELVKASEMGESKNFLVDPMQSEKDNYLFTQLNDPDRLACVLDDKKLQEKVRELDDKTREEYYLLMAYRKGTGKEKTEAAMKLAARAAQAHPEIHESINKQRETLEIQYRQRREIELNEIESKIRSTIVKNNERAKEQNELSETANRETEENNAEIDAAIAEKQAERENMLAEYESRRKQAEEYRTQRAADFDKAEKDYYERKDALTEKVGRLKDTYADLSPLIEAGKFMADRKNLPPQEHFEKVQTLEEKSKVLDDFVDVMFQMSDKDRHAPRAAEMLTPEAIKTVKDLRERTAKLAAEKAAIDAKFQKETNPTKKAALTQSVMDATLKHGMAKVELDKWKEAAGLQDQMNALWEKYPEMKQDFQQRMKDPKKNAYDAMYDMWDATYKAAQAERKNYQAYYRNQKKFENGKYYMEKYGVTRVADIEKMGEELHQAETELEGLKAPDRAAYDKETREHSEELCSEKLTQEVQDYDQSLTEEIAELQEQKYEFFPYEEVLDEAGIENAVAQEMQKKTKELTERDDAFIQAEMDKFTKVKKDELLKLGEQSCVATGKALQEEDRFIQGAKDRVKELHKKAKEAYTQQSEVKAKWETKKNRPDRFAEGMEQELRSLSENMLKGKEKGHKDTPEFNRMKESLESAHQFLQDEENRKKLNALDEQTVNTFKGLMENMKTQSQQYTVEKQKGIHWFPSNMRSVRLNMADRLQNTADDMTSRFDKIQQLQTEKAEAQKQADRYCMEDPGEDYRTYVVRMVSPDTVKKLQQKEAAAIADSKKQEAAVKGVEQKGPSNSKAPKVSEI